MRARAASGRATAIRTLAGAGQPQVDRPGFTVVERDSTIGGGLLAGALAYRFFVLLLQSALLLVSGIR